MRVVAVGSGKGGVGKSTVTVNLGIALASQGLKVGILDADLYGPSIPIMTGLRQMSPNLVLDKEGKERFIPFSKFGLQIISIGFFVEEARSLVWRGPVLHSMLQKMIFDVLWGELDLMLIDLPPGTGDVPISLSNLLKINSSIIVTTPQEVAILDAIKAINSLETLEIPTLGIVENMAGFTPPGSTVSYPIFGTGKAEDLARRFSLPLLGSIPILPEIRQGGDEGHPYAMHRTSEHFTNLANAVWERI